MPRQTSKRAASGAHDDMSSAVSSIRRIVRFLRLASHRTQSDAGISAAQLFVLQQLGPGGELSLNELAERTVTDRSSVAGVVERLQRRGLVSRAPDPTDRRRAAIRITSAGRRLLRRAPTAPTTALVSALRQLNSRELIALAKSLSRLTVALGVSHERPIMLFADESNSGNASGASGPTRKRRR